MDYSKFQEKMNIKPKKLLMLFLVGSVLSWLFVVLLAYFFTASMFEDHLIHEAETQGKRLAFMFSLTEKGILANQSIFQSTIKEDIRAVAAFGKRLQEQTEKLNVVKIKIFNADFQVIYSTDKTVITGAFDKSNEELQQALLGGVSSEFVKKDQITDFVSEQRFNVDVVEVYVPIEVQQKIVGVFEIYTDVTAYLDRAKRTAYLSSSVVGLILFASFLFLYGLMFFGVKAIDRYEAILSRLATHDSLTNLLNRRMLMSRAQEELQREKRRQARRGGLFHLGFIMLDIDHFKEINDQQGHQAGDFVLKELASRIQKVLRGYDIFGRYGGEEFLVLVVDATPETICEVSRRIWESIRSLPFVYNGKAIKVTISLGISIVNKNTKTLVDVIACADKAMYKAKTSGRDQIQQAEACCEGFSERCNGKLEVGGVTTAL